MSIKFPINWSLPIPPQHYKHFVALSCQYLNSKAGTNIFQGSTEFWRSIIIHWSYENLVAYFIWTIYYIRQPNDFYKQKFANTTTKYITLYLINLMVLVFMRSKFECYRSLCSYMQCCLLEYLWHWHHRTMIGRDFISSRDNIIWLMTVLFSNSHDRTKSCADCLSKLRSLSLAVFHRRHRSINSASKINENNTASHICLVL